MRTYPNPWTDLPDRPPYVLPLDRAHVESFNADLPDGSRHRLRTELLPDPFTGPRDAPVVVLNLNPGYGGGEDDLHARREFEVELRRDIGDTTAARHMYLGSRWQDTDGGAWWGSAFGALRREGRSRDDLAAQVLAVEFHGYHSEQWSRLPITLPSQHHGFELVDDAVGRGATIVIMRGRREWLVAVPALRHHPRLVMARNPRQRALSPGNLGERGYALLREALAEM